MGFLDCLGLFGVFSKFCLAPYFQLFLLFFVFFSVFFWVSCVVWFLVFRGLFLAFFVYIIVFLFFFWFVVLHASQYHFCFNLTEKSFDFQTREKPMFPSLAPAQLANIG